MINQAVFQNVERPCRVEFFHRLTESPDPSIDGVEEVWAKIFAPGKQGNSTIVEKKAEQWLSEKKWAKDPFFEAYAEAYEIWKKDQSQPVIGSKLEHWPQMFGKTRELEACKKANIRTIEELAVCDEYTLQAIGLGARRLKEHATDWLRIAKDVGTAASQNAALKAENEALKRELAELKSGVQLEKRKPGRPPKVQEVQTTERAAPKPVPPGFNAETD